MGKNERKLVMLLIIAFLLGLLVGLRINEQKVINMRKELKEKEQIIWEYEALSHD